MRIELGDHSFDRALQELRAIDRVDVTVLDLHEHFRELLDRGVRRVVALVGLRDGADEDATDERSEDRP